MPVTYNDKLKLFIIRTNNTSYAFQIDEYNSLTNVHWGCFIQRDEDFPIYEMRYSRICSGKNGIRKIRNEYAGWGGLFYGIPAIKATFEDGVRDVELVYDSHIISEDGNHLSVLLKDCYYPLEVILNYEIFDDLDIINRNSVIINKGDSPIILNSVQSAVWHLPDSQQYRLTHLASCWGREYEICHQLVTRSKIELDSRSGISNSHQYPFFALDKDSRATELDGEVWFGTLQWSGNWKIIVEYDCYDNLAVTGGINDFDFSWTLEKDESLETPVFTAGFTVDGFNGASRMLHDYQRKYLNPRPWAEKPLPVVYNAWASFEFDINESLLMAQAEKAASLGVELFVVDDGWFSTRNDESSGLGDWYPSPDKFPRGLTSLIEKVNSLGMKFGIWVEPEMVNPNSNLYREHPDWVLNFPTRERELSRKQLVLNLARDDVKEYIILFLDKLLHENNISYLKWDMNRLFSQPGWPEIDAAKQQGFWYLYVKNLYEIFAYINKHFPDVIIENCASGGLRADLGMAKYCSRVNRSDNQDPLDSLILHEGFTYVNRSKAAGGGGHVSGVPNGINRRTTPLSFRAHVAMLGSFAIGLDLRKVSDEELNELKGYVDMHKRLRDIVHNGNMYRLASLRYKNYCAFCFVSLDKSKAVLFVFGSTMQFRQALPCILIPGLDPNALYQVKDGKIMSGLALKEIGIRVSLKGDYDSKVIEICKLK